MSADMNIDVTLRFTAETAFDVLANRIWFDHYRGTIVCRDVQAAEHLLEAARKVVDHFHALEQAKADRATDAVNEAAAESKLEEAQPGMAGDWSGENA